MVWILIIQLLLPSTLPEPGLNTCPEKWTVCSKKVSYKKSTKHVGILEEIEKHIRMCMEVEVSV